MLDAIRTNPKRGGGGIKGGQIVGATDDIDQGRKERLTEVRGEVIEKLVQAGTSARA